MRIFGLTALLLVAGCGPKTAKEAVEPSSNLAEPVAMAETVPEKLWVTSERLERFTCPSEECGVVGQLSFREAATVYERKGGWARVSRVYDAGCKGGSSAFVDKGPADCTPANGIADGKFAEWVKAGYLSINRPPDPAETASVDEKIVAQSDDFARHRKAFLKAAQALISDGRCTAKDLEENGGWLKSMSDKEKPIYFTYCGGYTIANRLYLDASTGRIYR